MGGAARLDWCAAATTVRSSEPTTTRKMTAVRGRQVDLEDIQPGPQTGLPGQAGSVLVLELSRGNRSAGNESAVLTMVGREPGTLSRDILTPNVIITKYNRK